MQNDTAEKLNKRMKGSYYEHIAARFLELNGYVVLCRNYRCRTAEIDIVAVDTGTGGMDIYGKNSGNDGMTGSMDSGRYGILCFVEVKYRSSLRYGLPSEAVDRHKQYKLKTAAMHYIAEKHMYGRPARFDVVEIAGDKIRIVRDCFSV